MTLISFKTAISISLFLVRFYNYCCVKHLLKHFPAEVVVLGEFLKSGVVFTQIVTFLTENNNILITACVFLSYTTNCVKYNIKASFLKLGSNGHIVEDSCIQKFYA